MVRRRNPAPNHMSVPDPEQLRRKNIRLGLMLGAIAIAFFVGVIVKHILQT